MQELRLCRVFAKFFYDAEKTYNLIGYSFSKSCTKWEKKYSDDIKLYQIAWGLKKCLP